MHNTVIDYVVEQLNINKNQQRGQQLSPKSERLRKHENFEFLNIRKIDAVNRQKLKDAIFKTLSVELSFDEFEAAILKWCLEEGSARQA